MSYLIFLRHNWRFIGFGLLLNLSSGFGQTFFIALFSADIRAAFQLSHGNFGLIYSLATVASAGSLMWVGRWVDRIDLRLYALCICAAVAVASIVLGLAGSIPVLAAAIFVLRLSGQGLMTHTASTSMARYFSSNRGKAMSLASLGLPLAEGLFPLAAVALIAAVGWRQSLGLIGGLMALGVAPLVLWLLRGHGARHRQLLEETAAGVGAARAGHQWTRAEVMGDPRFYMILPAMIASPFLLTGLFFHQVHLATSKGWSLTWLATCFLGFAVAKVVSSLAFGPLVDRFGAARLLPWVLPIVGLALLPLIFVSHPGGALLYMGLAGINVGATVTIAGALWAEMYGVAHLGAIKALTAAIMVFATALAPVGMGWMVDSGVSIEAIAAMGVAYTVLCFPLLVVALRRKIAA